MLDSVDEHRDPGRIRLDHERAHVRRRSGLAVQLQASHPAAAEQEHDGREHHVTRRGSRSVRGRGRRHRHRCKWRVRIEQRFSFNCRPLHIRKRRSRTEQLRDVPRGGNRRRRLHWCGLGGEPEFRAKILRYCVGWPIRARRGKRRIERGGKIVDRVYHRCRRLDSSHGFRRRRLQQRRDVARHERLERHRRRHIHPVVGNHLVERGHRLGSGSERTPHVDLQRARKPRAQCLR